LPGCTGVLTDPPCNVSTGVASTDWTHLSQRWHNPATGSFTSQDASTYLADPANGNRYTYAADNPANYTDPTGRCFLWLFGSGCNNPVYNFINGSCVNAWSATIGGGVFAVASGWFGVITSESGGGIAAGWGGIVLGVTSTYQGYTALTNGACS
jgi:RHS repeat-associated protein